LVSNLSIIDYCWFKLDLGLGSKSMQKLIKLLAAKFGVPKSSITIKLGLLSKTKWVEIEL